ncbi:MAG: hypothetical protein ACAH21_15865 [Ramlibacter sp.]
MTRGKARWPAGAEIAVVVGMLLLTYACGAALFAPAPPMLGRAARVLTIAMLLVIHGLVLFAAVRAIRAVPARWPVAGRIAGIGFVAAAAWAPSAFAAFFAFMAVHAACYAAGACAISSVPEQVLHAINVATSYTPIESGIVVAAVIAVAAGTRRVT